jgi:hypothetical protein
MPLLEVEEAHQREAHGEGRDQSRTKLGSARDRMIALEVVEIVDEPKTGEQRKQRSEPAQR